MSEYDLSKDFLNELLNIAKWCVGQNRNSCDVEIESERGTFKATINFDFDFREVTDADSN